MRIGFSQRAALLVVTVLTVAFPAAAVTKAVRRALALTPSESAGYLLVPNFDLASEDLAACLASMDRGDLLMGGRPHDLIKSATGFVQHVRESGAVVIAWSRTPGVTDGAGPAPGPDLFLIIPVTDPAAFLNTNLEPWADEPGAWRHQSGRRYYARLFDSHVVLSPSKRALDYEPAGDAAADDLERVLGPRGTAILASDVIALADGPLARLAIRGAMAQAREGRAAAILGRLGLAAPDPQTVDAWLGPDDAPMLAVRKSVVALDFDPLGVIQRSFVVLDPDSTPAVIAAGGPADSGGLSRLPAKPYYIAASVDIAGLGGTRGLGRLDRMLPLLELPEWLRTVRGAQFAAYVSPAGLAGGMLNDAMLIIETDDPAGASAIARAGIDARARRDDGIRRQVTWDDDHPVEDVGEIEAFEVRAVEVPPEHTMRHVITSLIVGRMGWRGFLYPTGDGLIMTFSQRSGTLKSAISASTGKSAGLDEDSVVRAMRRWMPPEPDIEVYTRFSPMIRLMQQAMGAYPVLGDLPLPEVSGNLTPVGFGVSVNDGTIESVAIMPADVAAVAADLVIDLIPGADRAEP